MARGRLSPHRHACRATKSGLHPLRSRAWLRLASDAGTSRLRLAWDAACCDCPRAPSRVQVHLRHLVGGRARGPQGGLPNERIFQVRGVPAGQAGQAPQAWAACLRAPVSSHVWASLWRRCARSRCAPAVRPRRNARPVGRDPTSTAGPARCRGRVWPLVAASCPNRALVPACGGCGASTPARTHAPGLRFVPQVDFPERPGALRKFLQVLSPRWNVSLFHYRRTGARTCAGSRQPCGCDGRRRNGHVVYLEFRVGLPLLDRAQLCTAAPAWLLPVGPKLRLGEAVRLEGAPPLPPQHQWQAREPRSRCIVSG